MYTSFSVILGVFISIQASAATFGETAKNTFSPKTLGQDLISPITTTPARYALIAGTAITATVIAFKKDIDEPINDSFQRERPLGRSRLGDVFGQLVPNIFYTSTMLGIYAFGGDENALRRADLMFRTSLHTGLMTLGMKALFRAERPYDANVKTSFPSGHSSMAFAFASAVAMEHEWYWGAAAYAMATYVGASRINDHQHHFRDVLAGATLGISYGMGIYQRISNEKNQAVASERLNGSMMALLPTDDLSGAAFLYRASFR